MKNIFLLKIFLFIVVDASCFFSKALTLRQTIETALSSSLSFKINQSQKQTNELIVIESQNPYNWTLSSGVDSINKKISLSSIDEKWKNYFSLQKKFSWGMMFKMNYIKARNTSFPPACIVSPVSPVSDYSCDQISFSLEQDIFQNFLGRSDRLRLQSIQYRYESAELLRQKEVEKIAIQAAQKFWASYTIWSRLKIIQKRKKDLKELVQISKKKKKLGYNQPGEIPQILAQYEKTKKDEDDIKILLKNSNDDLKTFIGIKNSSIRFSPHQSSKFPKNINKKIETLNSFKVIEKNKQSKISELNSKKYFYLPKISLKAEAAYSGKEAQKISAWKSFKDQKDPSFSIGLQMIYPIPSTLGGWKKISLQKNLQNQYEMEHLQQVQNLSNEIKFSWNLLKSAHNSLLSTAKIVQLQKQAINEIKKSYIQGRTRINDLISAQDRYLSLELEKINAQKIYSLSLLKFYSLRDELIKQYMK